MFSETTATRKIVALNKKIRAVQGGTSASKTISILIYLISMCQTDKEKTLTSVVSESMPHLKKGAMRDFKNIMQAHKYWKESAWNATDSIYTFETGSQLEFFSADMPDKLRGARRERLFINEANNIPLDAFDQLEVRTKEFVFIDWNPTNEFWFYTEVLPEREDVDHITLTYLDNEALSQEIVDSIEARKGRTGWWKVYGLGTSTVTSDFVSGFPSAISQAIFGSICFRYSTFCSSGRASRYSRTNVFNDFPLGRPLGFPLCPGLNCVGFNHS